MSSRINKRLVYNIHSFPIILTLNPDSLDPAILSAHPRLVTGEIIYSPEFKQLALDDLGEIRLNPAMEQYKIAGKYQQTFSFPVVADTVKSINERNVYNIVQSNFEEQIMRSQLDMSSYRRIFENVGIHLIFPNENVMGLQPFLVAQNGLSDNPLVLRSMISQSLHSTIYQVSDLVLKYLFTESA